MYWKVFLTSFLLHNLKCTLTPFSLVIDEVVRTRTASISGSRLRVDDARRGW